ncbi:tetratricopeptide repeat protein [Candidatus Omnitrophota bacterium]
MQLLRFVSYYRAGERFNAAGEHAQAIAAFNTALKLDPSFIEKSTRKRIYFYHEIAKAESGLGNYQEAIALYRKILNQDSNNSRAHRRLADLYAQTASDNDKQTLQEAWRCMEKYFELVSDCKNCVKEEDRDFAELLKKRIAK